MFWISPPIFPLTTRTPVACRPIRKYKESTKSTISPGQTCSRPMHLRLEPHHQWNLRLEWEEAFVRGSTTTECRGSIAQNRGIFAGPRAGYSENRNRSAQQMIPWPNVVKRRAAVELTGAVTHYRGLCHNNNNNDNNHAALAKRF